MSLAAVENGGMGEEPYRLSVTRIIQADYLTSYARLKEKFTGLGLNLDVHYEGRSFCPTEICMQASRRARVLACRLLVPKRECRLHEIRQWFDKELMRPAMPEELFSYVLGYDSFRREFDRLDLLPIIALGSVARYGDNLVVPMWRHEVRPALMLIQQAHQWLPKFAFLGVRLTKRSF